MKSSKFKVVALVLGLFVVLVGGLFYYASTKLKPEEIKKLAILEVGKVFPKSEVELSNVDIGFGFNFKVNIQKFKISALKESGKVDMLSVDQLVVKIPLWSILTNSGIIEIKLDAPMLNYQEFSEGNNWSYAMAGTEAKKEESNANNDGSKKGLESESANNAVDMFGKSKINVRFSDVTVKYGLRDNSNGEIKVSKFLIKGLNFENSTAFEVQSSANFTMKDSSVVSFETLAIGQFNISDLVKTGSVTSNVNIKISHIAKTGLDLKFPDVVTDVDILLKKDGELSGKTVTTFEGQNKITSNFKMTKQIEISDINVDIVMKDVAAILGLEKLADMSKAKLSAKGSFVYTNDKKMIPNLNFSISPGIGYSKDGISASTTLSGEMKGKDLSGKSKTEILDGTINSTVVGEYDLNQKFDMSKLRPFEIKVTAAGMKIPEKLIRSKLWDKKPVEEETNDSAVTTKDSTSKSGKDKAQDAQSLPPVNVNIDWSNINVGGEDFSGKGRLVTSNKTIAIDNLGFKFSKGTGKLTQTMTLQKGYSDSKFNFEITNLNLNSFKSFLPPFIENFSGSFTGKVTGNATIPSAMGKMPTYDVTVVTTATKGEIKKLNIGEYINPMLANIPVVKDQMKDKQLKIDGNFETMSMKGRFTNSQYSLNSFEFVGIDKKVQVSGSGEIYPIAGKNLSLVEVNFVDNTGKISDVLQKNVGTKILPMKLSGPGFELKPDYGYTVGKLAKGAFKTKGEEKLKEVVEKNIDKLVPEKAKEKVKGILNGLFKR
jgi:hypothetical protein